MLWWGQVARIHALRQPPPVEAHAVDLSHGPVALYTKSNLGSSEAEPSPWGSFSLRRLHGVVFCIQYSRAIANASLASVHQPTKRSCCLFAQMLIHSTPVHDTTTHHNIYTTITHSHHDFATLAPDASSCSEYPSRRAREGDQTSGALGHTQL